MTQEAIQISETPPLPGLKLVQDVNKALQTIATDFAGPTDPAGLPGCGPYCTWADTANMLLKRRNAANTAWEIESQLFVPGILVLPTTPTSRLSDVIYVLDRGQILRWQTIGTYTGYASAEVGDFRWGTSITPKPGTELLIGQTIDQTLPKYAALVAWADANGHMVASGSWTKGAFHFASLGGNSVRLPDLRDMFIRATGTDADTANARALGTKQLDALQNIVGTLTNIVRFNLPGAGGAFSWTSGSSAVFSSGSSGGNGNISFDASLSARTSSETRGTNIALHPLIAL